MEANNMAAMCEALGDLYNILEKIQSFTPCLKDVSLMREFRSRVCHAKRVIDIALSAPARNCDRVKTGKEAKYRFLQIAELPEGNGDADMREWYRKLIAWLFEPAKKGEDDGR